MTAISWSSAGSGLWQVASNWTPAQVPGASDTATIGVAGAITVTSNADVMVGTTIVDDNMTLAINDNTTFHTTDGSTTAQGAIKVNNGGTFELGKDSTATTFTNVGTVKLEGGGATTDLTIAGNVTLSGGSGNSTIHTDSNHAASAGFIIAGDGVGSPTLTLASSEYISTDGGTTVISALTLSLETNAHFFVNSGMAIIATGTNTVTNNGGVIQAVGSGQLFIDSPVDNGGFIAAGGGNYGYEGGMVVISAAVTGGGSTVAINGYGVLELASGGSVASVVQLRGTGNTLRLDTGTNQVAAGIAGAVAGDNFDLAFQPFAAGDHAAWTQTSGSGGTLALLDSSNTTLATLSLSGQYTSANFATASDGHGGTRGDPASSRWHHGRHDHEQRCRRY
jgi:fibronectin-binding autotransporter adhesin